LHYRESLPEQKALFREAFEDQRTLPSRVKQVYETFHTDDYPHMQATLVLQSGVQVRQMMGILGSDPVNRLESLLCGNLVSPDFLTKLKDISVRE
jgi:hypothetical protein